MKKFLRIVLVVIVLVMVAAVAAYFYIDTLAKRGIERGATHALGVNTTVDTANVGLRSGTFSMQQLEVDNPSGYAAGHFLQLKFAEVALDWQSLFDDTIVLPDLYLGGADMHLERTGSGSNYQIILDNLKKLESSDAKAGKKYIIKNLTINDIMVHLNVAPLNVPGAAQFTKLDVPIDQIVLKDVGSDSDRGVVMAELADVVVKAILQSVVQKAGGLIPADILGDLRDHLAQLTDLSKITDIADLGDIGKTLGDLGAPVKNIGDIFDRDDDK